MGNQCPWGGTSEFYFIFKIKYFSNERDSKSLTHIHSALVFPPYKFTLKRKYYRN